MICYAGDWYGCKEVPFEERYRLIKQAGFDGVYAWWNEEGMDDYRAQPEMIRGLGLYIENIHAETGGSNYFWEDTADGAATFKYYLDLIGECAEAEIPLFVIHMGIGAGCLPPVSDVSVTRLRSMIDKAERSGVNIAIENQCAPDKNERAMEILEMFGSQRLGMCYDSGHGNVLHSNGTGRKMLKRFGHRLTALHLHDNDGSGDRHRLPFDGSIDWPTLMRQIEELGYKGPTTLEMGGEYPDLTAEEFLGIAFERAKKLDDLRKRQ
ncbi:MAG: sugar phosphate isomerase/epimerase [Oscillospiraceae bacterium]|nr:sugar phosphate isomerase/epimerase [Oscillospiraceae bacterium]